MLVEDVSGSLWTAPVCATDLRITRWRNEQGNVSEGSTDTRPVRIDSASWHGRYCITESAYVRGMLGVGLFDNLACEAVGDFCDSTTSSVWDWLEVLYETFPEKRAIVEDYSNLGIHESLLDVIGSAHWEQDGPHKRHSLSEPDPIKVAWLPHNIFLTSAKAIELLLERKVDPQRVPEDRPSAGLTADGGRANDPDATPIRPLEVLDGYSDSREIVMFDPTDTTSWGPKVYRETVVPALAACTVTVESKLYRHKSGHWTLIDSKENIDIREYEPEARQLTDTEAVDWLVRNGYEAPPELAHLRADTLFTPGGSVEKGTTEANENAPVKPSWDGERRELWFAGNICKAFRQQAPNQTGILYAFEESGWPARIDDPIPPLPNSDQRQRLADAVRSLNDNGVIHFELDGTREGIIWNPPPDERA